MAKHFNVGLRMYQKYENGKAEPEGITYGKWIKRIDLLEKLETLPPLQNEHSQKSKEIVNNNLRPSTLDELSHELIKKENQIDAMWDLIASLNMTIKLLSDKAGIDLQKFKQVPTKTIL